MKQKIFLLRHADYSDGENPGLSDLGKEQSQRLAKKVKSEIGDSLGEIQIWTSPARRARETALIIAGAIPAADFSIKKQLWSDAEHDEDFMWLKAEIDNSTADVLIIISHLEYVQEFPVYLSAPMNEAQYAEGIMIQDGQHKYIQ